MPTWLTVLLWIAAASTATTCLFLALFKGWWNIWLEPIIGRVFRLKECLIWKSSSGYNRFELWRLPGGSMYYRILRFWEGKCPWPCGRYADIYRGWTFGFRPDANPYEAMRAAFPESPEITWKCWSCGRKHTFRGNLEIGGEYSRAADWWNRYRNRRRSA